MKGFLLKTKKHTGFTIILRRFSQTFFLVAFVILFLNTDYNGSDEISSAVNLLFRIDPFLATCVMLGVKAVVGLLLPAIAVLVATLFFGRGFCGWLCPMGTLLDLFGRFFARKRMRIESYWPNFPLYLLVFSLVGSFFGIAIFGFIDPFSILVRGMAQAIYPTFNELTVGLFTFTYRQLPEFVNQITEPVYALLKDWILPSEQKFFQLAYLSFISLFVVFIVEAIQRRFFCRNICPLGGMLRLFSQLGVLRGRGGNDDCGSCQICHTNCRMGAIASNRRIDMGGCNVCFECVERCPKKIITFGFGWQDSEVTEHSISFSRRKFIGAAFAGVLFPSIKRIEPIQMNPDPRVIRPPGALAEKEFLQRCVRCAECVQVCIGNALQPAFLQAGLDGMFSPLLVARSGYCEFNCTLCGQVCPTGAIQKLTQEVKWKVKIGHAWFDKNSCLPYAKGIPCMVCEEHCPTPEKAIRFQIIQVKNNEERLITIKQPYIVDELCIGCGICETKCPIPGKSAIYLTSAGEDRNADNSLPMVPAGPYGN